MNTFLDSLPPDLRNAVENAATTVTLEAGQTVFKRGDPGEAFYVIERGRVRVHDDDLVLNNLGEGEAFGEIAGLGGMERTASVTAEADLTLLRIERETLYATLQTRPKALQGLIKMLCERESGMANRMTRKSWRLQAAEHELEIGRRIQSGFLPHALPKIPEYEVAGHFQAARVVAGDFYDAFYIPAIDRLALVIGDVCDKGVGAALFMTLFRSLIRATAQSTDFMTWAVDEHPGEISAPAEQDRAALARQTLTNTVSLTNNYVATTHGDTSMFASVFVGLLDPQTGAIDYVNAGHEEAFILGMNGIRLTLPPTGPVLGIFAGANYEVASTELERGETLLLYTDGVPEATSETGEQYAEERLRSLVEPWQGGANELLEKINDSVTEFTRNARQHDDITMLASYRKTL
jgi:sigma-B regulation protein RsbU (phosphoserine phosphatase)